MENKRLKEVYLAFTDILDRHEEFEEEEIEQFLSLINLAQEGFKDDN